MIGPRKVYKPLVLYGYGNLGHLAEEIFGELKIPVLIWDKNLPCPVAQYPEYFLLAICVASEPYEKVITPLVAAGWTDIVPVWDIIEAYPSVGLGNGWFIENWNELYEIDRIWGDCKSLLHHAAFLFWHKCRRDVPDDAFIPEPCESLPSTLADIRRRQKVDTYADAPMKEIVIHNEGCELKTLEINIGLFKKYRPKLTVACYHSHDGLWKIPKFLMDNLEDYTFTFRCHAFMGQAAYIYCTPIERREK